jgi:hypothetical protein
MAAIAGCSAQKTPVESPSRPVFAVSPNIKEGGTIVDLVKNLQDLRAHHLTGMYVSVRWNELEPEKGKFNTKPIDDAVRGLGGLGFTLAVTVQTLDTNNRVVPSDLMEKPFDSPDMQQRFESLIKMIVPRLSDKVRWLMLGNEVDVYLAEHPSELEAYAAFVERGRRTAKDLKPGLPIGVTCTFDGARARLASFHRLNRETDVVTLTYYPLGPDFGVRPLSKVPDEVAQMVKMAGVKPLLIQEAGYPADPTLGSSEEKQAGFVDAMFNAVKVHEERIALVNFFLLIDFSDSMLDTLLKYYRLPNARFRAFLATLGLARKNGTPRKSYDVFMRRLAEW